MWFDCHTHGEARPFSESRAIFSLDYSQKAALGNSNAAFSIGFHPWHLPNPLDFDAQLDDLANLAAAPNVWAIGEAGLDKYYETLHSPQYQKYALAAQIALAQSLNKAIILHTVARYNETLQLLKAAAPNIPIILHGFAQRPEVAQMFWRLGIYTSFGAAIMHNPNAQASLRACPPNLLLLETDAQNQYNIDAIYAQATTLLLY